MATTPKPLSHAQKTQIGFLHADIRALEACFKEIEGTDLDVTVAVTTGLTQALEKKQQKVQEVLKNIFKAEDNALLLLRLLRAAELVDPKNKIRAGASAAEKEDYRRALKERIALSKDLLTEAIELLRAKIATLEGKNEVPKVEDRKPLGGDDQERNDQPGGSNGTTIRKADTDPPRPPVLVVKPKVWGIELDVNEAWRRFQEWRSKKK
jgi:hypothetical protein